MTRGKKQSFAIDAQRGEGSAERERLLRAQPLEAEVTEFSPAVQPLPEQPPQPSPLAGNVFRGTERPNIEIKDTLPTVPGFEVEQPEGIDRTNALLAAINDLLGGSEEATAMMR
jgi:hypothetical protein